MLMDGQMVALYDNVFKDSPDSLGPKGSHQQPFIFSNAFLNSPSAAATAKAQRLLTAASIEFCRRGLERD